jgi:hypothetical protein
MEQRHRAEYGLVYGFSTTAPAQYKTFLDRAVLRPGRVKEQMAMISLVVSKNQIPKIDRGTPAKGRFLQAAGQKPSVADLRLNDELQVSIESERVKTTARLGKKFRCDLVRIGKKGTIR